MMEQEGGGTLKNTKELSPKMMAGIVIGILALIFIFQNTNTRTVHFLWMDFGLATWIWLLIIFVAGALVGYMFARRRAKRDAE